MPILNRPRLALGIESSCDETGAALVRSDGTVLSDVVHSQVGLHAPYGGVVPELASRDHLRNLPAVAREALAKAGATFEDVDLVAVTNRPGLVGALLVGVQAAKGIAWALGRPLYGVDHLVGHILSVYLARSGEASPDPPKGSFACLIVSGGHTVLYRVDAPIPSAIHELGATRDDAAGEAFDKVGKLLGLGYPGGPRVEALAAKGDPTAVSLPRPLARTLEFSFSGIKTAVAVLVEKQGVPEGQALADLCASFQAVVTQTLAEKLARAAAQEGLRDIVIGGGVAANGELRARVSAAAQTHGLRAHLPSKASCTDNAAMIAYAGAVRAESEPPDDWGLVATSQSVLPRLTRKGRGQR